MPVVPGSTGSASPWKPGAVVPLAEVVAALWGPHLQGTGTGGRPSITNCPGPGASPADPTGSQPGGASTWASTSAPAIGAPVSASTTRPLIDPPAGRSTSAVEPDERHAQASRHVANE